MYYILEIGLVAAALAVEYWLTLLHERRLDD